MFKKIINSPLFFWLYPFTIFVVSIFSVNLFLETWIWSPLFHFLGGTAVAIVFLHYWETHKHVYFYKDHPLFNLVFLVSFVAFVGVMWEFYEFLCDALLPTMPLLHPFAAQPSLADTMADLAFDMGGGVVVFLWYYFVLNFSIVPTRVPSVLKNLRDQEIVATAAVKQGTSEERRWHEV